MKKTEFIRSLLLVLFLTACVDEDNVKRGLIPAESRIYTLDVEMVQGANPPPGGSFSVAQYLRDHYGVIYDSATLQYPSIQINVDFQLPKIQIQSGIFGMHEAIGIQNEAVIVNHDSPSPAWVHSSDDSISFEGTKEAAMRDLQPYLEAAKNSIPEYQEAIKVVVQENTKLRLPGKDDEGVTRVLKCNPGSVQVSCIAINDFTTVTGRDWDQTHTVSLVGKTACVVKVKFFIDSCAF